MTDQLSALKTADDRRRLGRTACLHLLSAGLSLAFALPFVWMALTSLKPLNEVGLTNWLPGSFQWHNYRRVFDVIPFGMFYWNSIFVAAWVTFLPVSYTHLTLPTNREV